MLRLLCAEAEEDIMMGGFCFLRDRHWPPQSFAGPFAIISSRTIIIVAVLLLVLLVIIDVDSTLGLCLSRPKGSWRLLCIHQAENARRGEVLRWKVQE